jgi:hypothetical protein
VWKTGDFLLRTRQEVIMDWVGIAGLAMAPARKFFGWLAGGFRRPNVSLPIPDKSVIVAYDDRRPDWTMGHSVTHETDLMNLHVDFHITNVCEYEVLLVGAKIKEPPVTGDVMVEEYDGGYMGRYYIPPAETVRGVASFSIMPPVREKGEGIKADVALIDQFNNEHWVKGIEFKYGRR